METRGGAEGRRQAEDLDLGLVGGAMGRGVRGFKLGQGQGEGGEAQNSHLGLVGGAKRGGGVRGFSPGAGGRGKKGAEPDGSNLGWWEGQKRGGGVR